MGRYKVYGSHQLEQRIKLSGLRNLWDIILQIGLWTLIKFKNVEYNSRGIWIGLSTAAYNVYKIKLLFIYLKNSYYELDVKILLIMFLIGNIKEKKQFTRKLLSNMFPWCTLNFISLTIFILDNWSIYYLLHSQKIFKLSLIFRSWLLFKKVLVLKMTVEKLKY